MATNTSNYGLTKPGQNDNYDIDVQNGNMDKIDAQLFANAQAATSAQQTANQATAADSATDTIIGNRTADPSKSPSGLTGSLTSWLSWIANRIKAITGTANWFDAPPTTLVAVNTHMEDESNPHAVTYSQVGAAPANHVGTGGAEHATATQTAAGFMSSADKSKLDGIATGATNYTPPADMARTGIGQTFTASQNFMSPVSLLPASAATSSTSYGSPTFRFYRNFWNGTTSVSAYSYFYYSSIGNVAFVNESGSQKWFLSQSGGMTVYDRLQSNVPDGTPPFALVSKTTTPNMSADMVDGLHAQDLQVLSFMF